MPKYSFEDLEKLEKAQAPDIRAGIMTFDENTQDIEFAAVLDNAELKEIRFTSPQPNLRYLHIARCGVEKIVFSHECPNLETVYIHGTKNESGQLSHFELQTELPKLDLLDLSWNSHLKEIKGSANLSSLKYFYIHACNFESLKLLSDYFVDEDIDFNIQENKNLKYPAAELAEQGMYAVQDFFRSETVENNEVKLILTGNTTAGKTSLINFLTEGSYKKHNDSTHGISIKEAWQPFGNDELNVNIRDFGGQDYYHATHRLFLGSNSVYLLLWEKSKNKSGTFPTKIKIAGKEKPEIKNLQHYHYSYWLNLIRRYDKKPEKDSKTSDRQTALSPLFMLQNKIDEAGNEQENSDKELLDSFEAKDYHISIEKAFEDKDTESMYSLQFKLFRTELLSVLKATAAGIEIQMYIANVRKALRDAREKGTIEKITDWEAYTAFCREHAQEKLDDGKIEILTRYLHDTGVILYFGYNDNLLPDSLLKKTVFIDPKYVSHGIYEILDFRVQDNHGKFTRDHVIRVLGDEQEADRFIALMQSPNFELIFRHPEEADTYIAAQYLPDENPEKNTRSFRKLQRDMQTALTIHFNRFFSPGIMSRFIARKGWDTKDNIVWKYGIVYETSGTDIFVRCDLENDKICAETYEPNLQSAIVKEVLDIFIKIYGTEEGIEVSANGGEFHNWADIKSKKDYNPQECLFLLRQDSDLKGTDKKNTDMKKKNENTIKGNRNITLQDIKGNITINQGSIQDEPSDKYKILFMAANPTDEARLQTDKEYRKVKEILSAGTDRDSFDPLLPEFALTIDGLIKAMNQNPAIVHFSGHGATKGICITNDKNESKLLPENALKRLFKQHAENTLLVFLNACYSGSQAETISKLGLYFIGMKDTISDTGAISFSSGLYLGLAAGKTVEKAYIDALIKLETESPKEIGIPEIWKDGHKLDL